MNLKIHSSFLCERMGLYLRRKSTCIREAIDSRVAMSLQRVQIGNMLYIVRKVYGMAKRIILEVMRTFCTSAKFICKAFLRNFQVLLDLGFGTRILGTS